MVNVGIKELNMWTCTDMSGRFLFRNIPEGRYTLQASCLGYEILAKTFIVPLKSNELEVFMKPTSLALEGVEITAKEGKRLGSTTTINTATLEHVQPTDLSDVLQMVPGNVSVNPNLNDPKQLTIRDLTPNTKTPDPMATLGTLLVIDGAPISNDANMQVNTTTNATTGTLTTSYASSATKGTDVRSIAVDNIESIEVVRGIASADQGDVLSGVVKVNLKKGKTPLMAKVKVDPNIKQFSVGKGLKLDKERGTLNLDADITKSLDDIRTPYKTYYRLTGSMAYSNTLFKNTRPLNVNFTVNYSGSEDSQKLDPDMKDVETFESSEQDLRMNLTGKWTLNTKLISCLNYNLSGNIQHQRSSQTDLRELNGEAPFTASEVDGESVGTYLPSSYISSFYIDGRPYYLNAKLSGVKNHRFTDEGLSNLKAGLEYYVYGNNGQGRVYSSAYPPANYYRPRSYKDIPAMHQLALFAEEELSIPIGKTKLELQAGLRFTNLQPDGLFTSTLSNTMLDPRTNLKYQVVDDPKGWITKLSIRFGYGVFSKAPTLLHFYPDKLYYDLVGFNYRDPGGSSLAVFTTRVLEDTKNPNLKPAQNRKFEGGIDVSFLGVEMLFTGFLERMKNGFSFQRMYETIYYNNYTSISNTKGLTPIYTPGMGITYTDPSTGNTVTIPYRQDTLWIDYSYPTNTGETTKIGVEYSLNFGTARSLRTTFMVDGAYLYVKKKDMADYMYKPTANYTGGYPYVGLYPGGKGDVQERFNTNVRTVTHIKELRMVISLTAQMIWFEKAQNIYEDANGNPLIYTLNPVPDVYADYTQVKYVNPYGYYDRSKTFHVFDPSMATTKPLSDLRLKANTTYYYAKNRSPFIYQINLKLTKELTSSANLSFFVNNVTNYRPLQQVAYNEYTRTRNSSIYFGAELKIKL